MESVRFQLNVDDLKKILQVLGWTVGTTLVGTLLTQMPMLQDAVHVAPQYALLMGLLWSVLNTGLVALNKFLQNKGALLPKK